MKKKKIGFLYGEESNFSKLVINEINDKKISEFVAEEIKIGIVNIADKTNYSIILDRFYHKFPFYYTALNFFAEQGTKIINAPQKSTFDEEFLSLTALKKLNINVPKTAVIPSKRLPNNINGEMLKNLIYPLDWNKLFDEIGFPADIMSNNLSNEFYDCFRIYNQQDFYSIYDISGENTLVLQETFAGDNSYHRVFVVGDDKFILKYDRYQPARLKYSLITEKIDKKTESSINTSIKKIVKNCNFDIFIADFIAADKVYLMQINKANINFDTAFIPAECYNWLVKSTADLLIKYAEKAEKEEKTKVVAK